MIESRNDTYSRFVLKLFVSCGFIKITENVLIEWFDVLFDYGSVHALSTFLFYLHVYM